MGLYFEVISAWHSSTESLSERPGFIMMELHTLVFEFCVPWWNSSLQEPSINSPRTFSAIDKLENTNMRETKINQMLAGIQASFDL